MILIYAVVVGLAAFRMWRVLAEDAITEPLRDWIYERAEDKWVSDPKTPIIRHLQRHPRWTFVANLIGCPWCLGFWYAGGLSLWVALSYDYRLIDFGLLWGASSAVCGLTQKWAER